MEDVPKKNSEKLNLQLQKQDQFRQTIPNKFLSSPKMDTSITQIHQFQPKRYKNIKVKESSDKYNTGYKYIHIPQKTEPTIYYENDTPQKKTQSMKVSNEKFIDHDMKYTSLRQKEKILLAIKQQGMISPQLSHRNKVYQQYKGILNQDKQIKEKKLFRLRSISEKEPYPLGIQKIKEQNLEAEEKFRNSKYENNFNELKINNQLTQNLPIFPQKNNQESNNNNILERQKSYIRALSQRNSSPLNKLLNSVELHYKDEMVPYDLEIKPLKKTHYNGLKALTLNQQQTFNQIKNPQILTKYKKYNEDIGNQLYNQYQTEKMKKRVQRIKNAPQELNLIERSTKILEQNNIKTPQKNLKNSYNGTFRGNSLGSTLETSQFNWQNRSETKKKIDLFAQTYNENDFSKFLNTQKFSQTPKNCI
ncbi:hypothetical protein PPERSA_05616 [Pseudocohnilembus persalinus]|uniref:Uncharacterized protein n=1 Tax=Pseudocohnilembus persalinus TaxID=266149 RepID=A0A0V0QGG9_PSEPJ|nr:hypothetical protein PPERSA_05616 [Pseudocohnilembus persalinus]|eukprot:KRX01216.1 hypothetical protein PPERSA_05616 [Pseudocohnilembus persalinus]